MKKVLYHGTGSEFCAFDFSRCGSSTADMSGTGALGAWFTDDYEYAVCYARNAGGNTIYAALVDVGCIGDAWTSEDIERFVEANGIEAARAMLQDEGVTGVMVAGWTGNEYCVFSADLITRMWRVNGPLSDDEIAELEW